MLTAVAVAAALLPRAAAAQVTLGIGVAAVGSTNLVQDSIIGLIDVRPGIAPQVMLSVRSVLSDRYRAGGEISVSRSALTAHGDSARRVTDLTVWAPTVSLEMAATPWLWAEGRVGALIYDPSEVQGTLFSEGSPVTPVLGIGLRGRRAFGARFEGSVLVRYDVHRFSTNQLRARGFSGETVVHRLALGITFDWSLGSAPPRD